MSSCVSLRIASNHANVYCTQVFRFFGYLAAASSARIAAADVVGNDDTLTQMMSFTNRRG